MPPSSGRYNMSPLSDTVKLWVASVTVSVSRLSFTYSILPLAFLPGPLTMFSSITGRTVWAKRGKPSNKKNAAWREYLQARRFENKSRKRVIDVVLEYLRGGLRLNVHCSVIGCCGQIRCSRSTDVPGERSSRAACPIGVIDSDATDLHARSRG